MFSIFFISLVCSQRQICICNFECSSLCPTKTYIVTSSNSQTQYLYTMIKQDTDIELDFYSREDEFIFEVDISYFSDKKVTLKNLADSANIKLKIKDKTTRIIEIEPNLQIELPNLIPLKSIPNYSDKAILTETDPSTTPIPISVGMAQFKTTGSVTCDPQNIQFDIDHINDLNCPRENLNTPSAYNCGFRCWTSGETTFEYSFKGVKFAIYGTYDSQHRKFYVKIDENEPIEIDEERSDRQEHAQLYISEELDYKDHKLLIYGSDVYELFKIEFWPMLKARRLNSTELEKTDSEWTTESDGIGGTKQVTQTTGATSRSTIKTSKIWIYGTKSNSYGDLKVNFNDQEVTVSENSENKIEAFLLHETEEIDFGTYELVLTSLSSSPVSVYCVYYLFDPPPQTLAPYPTSTPKATPTPTPVPLSIGLTQMMTTGSKSCFPNVEFSITNVDKIGCDFTNLESPEAYNCGYKCWGNSMKFEYNFKGVMFQVYGTLDPNHFSFDLIIDDGDPIEINEHREERKEYELLFTSDELEYKEHNIKIVSKDATYELYKIAYWPSLRAKRINISEFKKEGTWIAESDGIGGKREYTESNGATASVSIPCSKLWVYGSTASWFRDFVINFNGEEININPTTDNRVDAVLFYESPDLPFNTYELLITSPIYPITIYNIFYVDDWAHPTETISASKSPCATLTATQSPDPTSTPEPTITPYPTLTATQSPEPSMTPEPSSTPHPTATPTPTPIPISVGLTQMDHEGRVYCNVAYFGMDNIQNLGCNIDDLEVESAYKCGYKCWSYGEANFTYTFKGVKFEIYGTLDPNHKRFDLTIDDEPTIVIDEYNETRYDYVVVYSSDQLDYKLHTIKINGKGEVYELYKLVYWPRNEARRMNSTRLIKEGEWKKESDGIGGVREYTNNAGDSASITFVCTKIWVYSSICNWHNNIIINFNNREHDVNLFSEVRQDGYLIFESEDVPYGEYTLSFKSGGTVMICYIYYLDDPPPPTRTPYPSRTEYPETSMTYIDKIFTNFILTDQIEVTENSPINQISGCQFIKILEDIDYLIRIEKKIPFFDNSFVYEFNQSNPCAPIYSCFNGQFSLVNCTFINSRCRTKNGGNIFTSPENFVIGLLIESCTFTDCGLFENETLIKISNLNSTIKMTDSSISFQNETTASKVIDTACSHVLIDNCTFLKSGTISIDSENSNVSFQFSNNKVYSICQPFICVTKVTFPPIIEDNLFSDIQVSNLSFINITHDIDEIELKNNVFENVKMEETDEFEGKFFILIQSIENLSTDIIFNNCSFVGNENNRSSSDSFYGMGGGFQYGYFYPIANVSIQFLRCEFKQNSCLNGKGGALALSVFCDVVISDCVFEGNSAEGEDGSAIFFFGDSNLDDQIQLNLISITNCLFTQNQGTSCIRVSEDKIKISTIEIYSCVFVDNDCESANQYMILTSSNNVNFVNNSVTFSDSSSKYGSFNINYTKMAVLTDTVFKNCQISTDVSLLFNGKDDNVLTTFSNCSFSNCISRRFSVSIQKGRSTVSNCSFSFTSNRNACSGLEISSPTTAEIFECRFVNNNNKLLNSGALFLHSGDNNKPLEKLTINGLFFTSCIGSSFRTISVNFPSIIEDLLTIEKVEIHNISTGASIYSISVDKNVVFKNCTFMNNFFGNELGGGYGSYLIPPTQISFIFCVWKNNYCSDNGGAFGGVIYNISSNPLLLKSLLFENCLFSSNSCQGNGGALYISMFSENMPISILNCTFEMNKANGDCGAIYVRNKGTLTVDYCIFINNSASKSLSSTSIEPTDALCVSGNANVFVKNSNFSKGSFSDGQTNYQFSHTNSENNRDFNITIFHSMFSVINPTTTQLFAKEATNVGSFYINHSQFTHFFTQNSYVNGLSLQTSTDGKSNRASQSNYNHLFRDLNAPVYITQCCFDNDEFIVSSNQPKLMNNHSNHLSNFLSFSVNDNFINAICSYPSIVDQLIIEIESFENKTNRPISPSSPPDKNPKNNKKTIIIASVSAAVAAVVIIVVVVVLVIYCKRKNSGSLDSQDEEIEAENEANERNFVNFATKMITQENPLFTRAKMSRMPSYDSEDESFEEARLSEEYI